MIDVRSAVTSWRTEINALATRSKLGLYIGWTGYNNLGDEALLACVRRLFQGRLFLYDKPYIGKGAALKLGMEKRFDCVMLGGGTLVNRADIYLRRFRDTQAPVKVVFGAGVANPPFWREEVSRPIAQDLAKWVPVLNETDYLGVRGPISRQVLQDGGVTRPVEIMGDPALYLALDTLAPRRRTGVIGLNIGHSHNLVWGRSDDAFLSRFRAIALALARKGWELVFFPVWDDDIKHGEAMAAAVRSAGGRASVEVIREPDAYVQRMKTVDVFIGEKLHAVILAACALTPVIMMEYRPKCRDFMASMDLEAYCRRINAVSADWIFDRVSACLAQEDALRQSLFERTRVYKARMRAAADRIAAKLE